MQVTETVSDGLKREFQVNVPAADLEARVTGRLAELKDRVQLRGFRPGKVPVTHLRKVYGRSVMAETIETIIRELNAKVVEERGLRLALEPKVTIPDQETEHERVIGMAAGETRSVNATFPAAYANPALAGKQAEFEVTAKSIEAPGTVTVDDAFAKSLGLESLDKLKGMVKERIAREHATMSRQK